MASRGPEWPPDSAHGGRRLPWGPETKALRPGAGARERENDFSRPLRGAILLSEDPHGSQPGCHGPTLVAAPRHAICGYIIFETGLDARPTFPALSGKAKTF